MRLDGLHHVTAVTANAPANLAFYTQVMGLRLVKKTVNQDDVSAYHLFYADALGSPGTDLTFFDWAMIPANVPGPGTISGTGLRVPGQQALEWWVAWLDHHHVPHSALESFHGHTLVRLTDPEGQPLMLIDDEGRPGGQPWAESPVPGAHAITGLYASTLTVGDLRGTAYVLTDIMGYEQTQIYEDRDDERTAVFESDGGGPGHELYVVEQPRRRPGRLGAGGVHHIAFRVPDSEAQEAWRQRLTGYGIGVTDIIDRFYFKSIYFRIPGGILFEIATDGPGFAADEDPAHLGEKLALPPFLEPRRRQIEAGLQPLDTART